MKNFFEKPKEKLFGLHALDSDTLLYRVLPRLMLEILRKYFRLEVTGTENLPKKGSALILPNHSGFSGFDAMLISHEILKASKRIPRVLTHHFWFLTPTTSIPAQKMGFIEANFKNGVEQLQKKNLVVLFPEGEHGNFKPSNKRYHLQEFKRGFVRMAIMTQTPIIPTLVVGAEEANINLSQLKFSKYLRGVVLPLPLNVIPLPVKWKICFLPPIKLPYPPEAAEDRELVHEIAQDIREQMQSRLTQLVQKRGSIF